MIEDQIAFWLGDINGDEHSLGYLLQWLVVLNDPDFADLNAEVASQSGLEVSSALRLYNHLVGLIPSEVGGYVIERLDSLDENAPLIVDLANGRLVSGLSPDEEGREPMRIPALLIP